MQVPAKALGASRRGERPVITLKLPAVLMSKSRRPMAGRQAQRRLHCWVQQLSSAEAEAEPPEAQEQESA